MDEIGEIILALERMLKGEDSTYEWDDRMGINFKDQKAETVRRLCFMVPDVFPPGNKNEWKLKGEWYCNPDGLAVLRTIADGLKKLRVESAN